MKSITLLFLLFFSLNSFCAEINCPKVISKGEGHWPVSSAAFNKERYEQAIAYLNEIVDVNAEGREYYNVENELMYIKGYMLKLHNESKEFCAFIKSEAYVRH